MSYTDIVEKQRWNDDTMRNLLEAFIRESGMWTVYVAYLEKKAEEENNRPEPEPRRKSYDEIRSERERLGNSTRRTSR
jgi:hypothetical protein